MKACQSLNLQNITLHQAELSGSSIDRAMNVRPLSECKSRGQYRTYQSLQRHGNSARVAADYLALVRRTRELIEKGSHPWNPPRLCMHRRLERQCILHLFAHSDVVVSRIRSYGVPCYSRREDQASLTLQRTYRVKMRSDIKDRRIAGALLIPSRGMDSLLIRCLHTC